MPTICSYFNPCSQDFNALEEFKNISFPKQVGIALITTLLACTIIFAPCATPLFRLLVDYCAAKPASPRTDEKAKEIGKKVLTDEKAAVADYRADDAWFQEPSGRSQFTAGLHSACTPLAVIFAASAGKVPDPTGIGTPQEIAQILDTFLKGGEAAGFKNGNNYEIKPSVEMISTLMKSNIEIEIVWIVNADEREAGYGVITAGTQISLTDMQKTWPKLISELQNGQGAVIITGAYALAVRRLKNSFFEFFDAHNGKDLGADKEGAYIKRCSSDEKACAFLKRVIASGPAGAGVEGMLANNVEIAILKSN